MHSAPTALISTKTLSARARARLAVERRRLERNVSRAGERSGPRFVPRLDRDTGGTRAARIGDVDGAFGAGVVMALTLAHGCRSPHSLMKELV
jgi:hypothetical protein